MELARQLLLGRVVVLPGVEAQQHVAHPQLLDQGEQRGGILRPGADADADPREVDRRRVKLPLQFPF